MAELNPDNLLVKALREQWQKLCAIVMHKQGMREINITREDIEAFVGMFEGELPVILVQEKGEVIVLKLVKWSDAEKLAKQHGEVL